MNAKELKTDDFFDIVVGIFKMIKESWEAVKLNLLTFILIGLVPLALVAIAIPLVILPLVAGTTTGSAVAFIFAMLMLVLIFLVALLFLPAITLTQLASVRGKKITFSQALEQSKKYVLRFFGLIILSLLVVGVGLLLFVIPGLLAIFFLSFAAYVLIDKDTSIVDAMKGSYELVKEYWLAVVGVIIVNVAISLPNYVPVIGWIVTLGLTVAYFCLSALVYVKITGRQTDVPKAKALKK